MNHSTLNTRIDKNIGKWFLMPGTDSQTKLRLICFPFAGGSASFYYAWAKKMPKHVELICIELPGRGARFHEPLIYHIDSLIPFLVEALKTVLDGHPFIAFGHSLGALIGFESLRQLESQGYKARAFIASGRRPPCAPKTERSLHEMTDEELILELERYNGTPAEVLADPEMQALVLPIVKADSHMNETYTCQPSFKLNCPIHAFSGTTDPVASPHHIKRWHEHTTAPFNYDVIEGGHFFIKEQEEIFLSHLTKICQTFIY